MHTVGRPFERLRPRKSGERRLCRRVEDHVPTGATAAPGRPAKADIWKLIAGIVLIVITAAALGVGGYVWATTPRPGARVPTSDCPVDGPKAITVALLDTSDDLPDPAKKEAKTFLRFPPKKLPAPSLKQRGRTRRQVKPHPVERKTRSKSGH